MKEFLIFTNIIFFVIVLHQNASIKDGDKTLEYVRKEIHKSNVENRNLKDQLQFMIDVRKDIHQI